jgi:hypothetical protein
MNLQDYRKRVLIIIERYLRDEISSKDASNQALDIIKSSDWENLPKEISEAVHLLFDLHDEGKPWHPTKEELTNSVAKLKNLEKM